jgi:hypothetical protein
VFRSVQSPKLNANLQDSLGIDGNCVERLTQALTTVDSDGTCREICDIFWKGTTMVGSGALLRGPRSVVGGFLPFRFGGIQLPFYKLI